MITAACLVAAGLCVFAQQQSTDPAKAQESKPQEAKPGESTKPTEPVPGEKVEVPPMAAAIDPKSYMIGSQDVVFVKVWREQELTGLYTVRPDGKISMPLAGDIAADGITPEALKDRIVTALAVYMTRPEVMIEIRQVNSKRYHITGEVGRPGAYPLITATTVLEALSLAGGLRDFANGKKIVIMRNGERLKFNYKDVTRGKNMEQNIRLEPGDHVIVP